MELLSLILIVLIQNAQLFVTGSTPILTDLLHTSANLCTSPRTGTNKGNIILVNGECTRRVMQYRGKAYSNIIIDCSNKTIAMYPTGSGANCAASNPLVESLNNTHVCFSQSNTNFIACCSSDSTVNCLDISMSPTQSPTTLPTASPTRSPVIKPTSSPTKKIITTNPACMLRNGVSQLQCIMMNKRCKSPSLPNPFKWTGAGCTVNGIRIRDGACRKNGYCGFNCESACEADAQCYWNGDKEQIGCYDKRTNTFGGISS